MTIDDNDKPSKVAQISDAGDLLTVCWYHDHSLHKTSRYVYKDFETVRVITPNPPST